MELKSDHKFMSCGISKTHGRFVLDTSVIIIKLKHSGHSWGEEILTQYRKRNFKNLFVTFTLTGIFEGWIQSVIDRNQRFVFLCSCLCVPL